FEGKKVTIGTGRFGPYVQHNKMYVSIPKNEDPMTLTLERAVELIEEKRRMEAKRHLKAFAEDPKMEILNGRYGPYICYNGKNYKLPKAMHEKVQELTLEECMGVVEAQTVKNSQMQ
ncbi:MAG: DNA topoisomerase I, partial [Prevotella sp.]|nr:DNA topoisomerase I [Prevotella sp.]